eukprot:Gb_35242 [translate_table: standard]
MPSNIIPARPYDVFINHRGKDVKKSLASIIYHILQPYGLRVFLDVEELQQGDFIPANIQEAISTASVNIAIFSENYGESPWCLAELSFMLKTGGKIIPVFYHVEPWALRYIEKGVYAHAFAQHEEKRRYPSEKLSEWKEALYNVSFLSGLELNKPNDDEGRLLKGIINSVIKEVKRVPLEVAEHPVGVDKIVHDFNCQLQSKNVNIAGIVGIGGCGKTTLAKEIYNRKRALFKASSFLYDVREASARNDLKTLQSKLLNDLVHIDCKINTTSEGKDILRDRLRNRSGFLLVLDDIDHEDQLDAFVAKDMGMTGGKNLMLVTTRDKSVLRRSGISMIFEVKGLNAKHARELFCWHAFLQPHPAVGFGDLVEDFLKSANGLPLSLKVLGGHLYGRYEKSYWETELKKISRILPRDIRQRLKISYDALEEEEKQIFLDIACFFIGEDKNKAIFIWEGSGWSGLHGFETLEYKCLVEVDDNNCLRMHDHLRDLGRDIAADESHFSRLWRPEDGRRYLQGEMGTKSNVRGIVTTYESPRWHIRNLLPLRKVPKKINCVGLKLLHLEGDIGKVQLSTQDLLWLRWVDCEDFSLNWSSLRNLRVLDLLESREIKELWKYKQAPLQLRELTISFCPFVELPQSMQLLTCLEKIVLDDWAGSFLPKEFCGLYSLKHLELRLCNQLRSLPELFGDLTNLQHLDIEECNSLKMLPNSIGQLTRLRYLCVTECKLLTIQLEILGNITTLEELNFFGCDSLLGCPTQITHQASLKKLNLFGNSIEFGNLPNEFWKLTNLQSLQIPLTSLPSSIGNLMRLTVLELRSSRELNSLPKSLGRLNLLTRLTLRGLGIEYLPQEIGQLINLQTLIVYDCPISQLRFANNTSTEALMKKPTLCQLQILSLVRTKLSTISISGEYCPNIETLDLSENEYLVEISGCCELQQLPSVAQLISLSVVEAIGCWKLQSVEGMERLERLSTLDISADNESLWIWMQSQKFLPRISNMFLRRRATRGRGVHALKSILNSFSFYLPPTDLQQPDVYFDHCGVKLSHNPYLCPTSPLTMTKLNACSAVIICRVIEHTEDEDYGVDRDEVANVPLWTSVEKEGEWIDIWLHRQDSFHMHFYEQERLFSKSAVYKTSRLGKGETKKALMLMFAKEEESKMVEVLSKIISSINV